MKRLWLILLMASCPILSSAQQCVHPDLTEITPTSRYIFGGSGTVTDKKTGLMWKRCLEGQIFSDNGTTNNYVDDLCIDGEKLYFIWDKALTLAQDNNANKYAGHNNWRVPNIKELVSIIEYCNSTARNTEVFLGETYSYYPFWSSSPIADSSGQNAGVWGTQGGKVTTRKIRDYIGFTAFGYLRLVRDIN